MIMDYNKKNGDDTSADNAIYGVKGGSWESGRTDYRTEYRDEGRDGTCGYEDVGFRITQVLNGKSNPSSDTDINTPDNGNNSDDNVVPPNQENNGNSSHLSQKSSVILHILEICL